MSQSDKDQVITYLRKLWPPDAKKVKFANTHLENLITDENLEFIEWFLQYQPIIWTDLFSLAYQHSSSRVVDLLFEKYPQQLQHDCLDYVLTRRDLPMSERLLDLKVPTSSKTLLLALCLPLEYRVRVYCRVIELIPETSQSLDWPYMQILNYRQFSLVDIVALLEVSVQHRGYLSSWNRDCLTMVFDLLAFAHQTDSYEKLWDVLLACRLTIDSIESYPQMDPLIPDYIRRVVRKGDYPIYLILSLDPKISEPFLPLDHKASISLLTNSFCIGKTAIASLLLDRICLSSDEIVTLIFRCYGDPNIWIPIWRDSRHRIRYSDYEGRFFQLHTLEREMVAKGYPFIVETSIEYLQKKTRLREFFENTGSITDLTSVKKGSIVICRSISDQGDINPEMLVYVKRVEDRKKKGEPKYRYVFLSNGIIMTSPPVDPFRCNLKPIIETDLPYDRKRNVHEKDPNICYRLYNVEMPCSLIYLAALALRQCKGKSVIEKMLPDELRNLVYRI